MRRSPLRLMEVWLLDCNGKPHAVHLHIHLRPLRWPRMICPLTSRNKRQRSTVKLQRISFTMKLVRNIPTHPIRLEATANKLLLAGAQSHPLTQWTARWYPLQMRHRIRCKLRPPRALLWTFMRWLHRPSKQREATKITKASLLQTMLICSGRRMHMWLTVGLWMSGKTRPAPRSFRGHPRAAAVAAWRNQSSLKMIHWWLRCFRDHQSSIFPMMALL
mmetsp:Transcript_124780/g.249188  ORF Transcript_124780/g.249188 Transcript_124780/m.249188 type:complete len:218 (+) Transcript_124780:286-939(+)